MQVRAGWLPPVLDAKFDRPDYLFAHDPAIHVHDGHNGPYSYVRPLATIGPTAIRLGMNTNALIGFTQIDHLQQELALPQYASAKVFIAWEHGYGGGFYAQTCSRPTAPIRTRCPSGPTAATTASMWCG